MMEEHFRRVSREEPGMVQIIGETSVGSLL